MPVTTSLRIALPLAVSLALACGEVSQTPDGGVVDADVADDCTTSLLFAKDDDIFHVDADGQGLANLTTTVNVLERAPRFSPDGTRFAFLGRATQGEDPPSLLYSANADGSSVAAVSLDPDDSVNALVWLTSDRLAFKSNRSGGFSIIIELFATNFDGSGRQLIRSAVTSTTAFAASETSDKLVVNISGSSIIELVSFSFGGTDEVQYGPGSEPTLSPDASLLVFSNSSDIHRVGIDGSSPLNLTSNAVPSSSSPKWSVDGASLYFLRRDSDDAESPRDVFVMNSDGTGQTALTASDDDASAIAVAPDGEHLAYIHGEVLVIRKLDDGTEIVVGGSTGASSPEWRPCSSS